jgi:hypothetical protein
MSGDSCHLAVIRRLGSSFDRCTCTCSRRSCLQMVRTHAVKATQMRGFAGLESFGRGNACFKNIVEASVTIELDTLMPCLRTTDQTMHTLVAITYPSARDKLVCMFRLPIGLLTWMLGNKVPSIGTVSHNSTIDSQSSEHGMLNLLMVRARVLVRVHARTIVRLRAVLAYQTHRPARCRSS